MYTVVLSLPDMAEPGDFDHEPTPVEAVEAFIVAMTGNPDHWVYRVTNEKTGEKFLVDMSDGPSVTVDES